ncbi:MAG: undecaprenyl/decaprenyl-phosphate alpha-N-acetylglucosaminyl 1-phosphate transferase [Armatimonadetes bacterium]|nr:undecaprenyl/decaprenyl-phosphate alpha-N-acetylglucosaminyl 1-phosphate transferase [Armatimonadota bacterium]
MTALATNALTVLIGLLGGLLLTPVSKVLARYVGAIDNPGELKVHAKAMPRFGGSAVWAATVLACFGGVVVQSVHVSAGGLFPVLIGATLVALIGAIDDTIGLSPKARLCAGVVAALVTAAGVFWAMPSAAWVRALVMCVSAVWLLGCANAMNMLDGLDGLAAGVSAIAAVGIGIAALVAGNMPCALLVLGLAGACVGFLRYNFRPASTFMGDVGSLFLGFTLASSVLLLAQDASGRPVLPLMLGAMVALGVPVGDMLLAMGRRLLNHKPMFQGDRSHFYDQLRDRFGFGVVKTVLTMYALAVAFSVLGVGISLLQGPQAVMATVACFVVAVVGVLRGGFLRREADVT